MHNLTAALRTQDRHHPSEQPHHLAILFQNIGGYHAARLQATDKACQAKGWRFSALQITHQTAEHPWGNQPLSFPLYTLLPNHQATYSDDRNLQTRVVQRAVHSCLDQLQPSVMAIPGWGFIASRAALRWCRRHHVPTILMSESKRDDEPRQWWKEQLKSWLWVRKFDAALVGGQAHERYLIELGLASDQIFQGYDVVDNDHFAHLAEVARRQPEGARLEHGIPDRPYFLCVTRLIPRKNIARLLDAYVQYVNTVGTSVAWDLVICGSGAEEARVQQQILRLDLKTHVHLPGFQSYQAIGAWYGLAAALIHPALQEQWGLVVNEACAAGLPILCSRTVGAAAALVEEGYNGLLFDPTDAADMIRVLLSLHHQPPESLHQMGGRSQQRVARFHPQVFAAGMMAAIAKATESHP